MPYCLGIDGGGTQTTAWLADERGRVLGRATAGPSNPLKVGFESCEREIRRAARNAVAALRARLETAGERRKKMSAADRRSRMPRLDAVVVGLSGVDRPPVHGRLLHWLLRAVPANSHLLTSDAEIALRAGIGNSPGMIVISGTGSIAYARDEQGQGHRAGGWGTLFDDAGSGYDLGRKAIAAALRALDGRGRRTLLTQKICRALNIPDMTRVVFRPLDPARIAALFPLVIEAARCKDRVASRLCEEAGQDLAELAAALLKRLGWERRSFPVLCAGGVFRSSLRIRRSFGRHLRRTSPRARMLLLRRPAVEGALALARDLALSL